MIQNLNAAHHHVPSNAILTFGNFLPLFVFSGVHASEMVDFMSELKSGEIDGVKVKLGKLQVFW